MPIREVKGGFKIDNVSGISPTREHAIKRLRAIKARQAAARRKMDEEEAPAVMVASPLGLPWWRTLHGTKDWLWWRHPDGDVKLHMQGRHDQADHGGGRRTSGLSRVGAVGGALAVAGATAYALKRRKWRQLAKRKRGALQWEARSSVEQARRQRQDPRYRELWDRSKRKPGQWRPGHQFPDYEFD